MKHLIIICSILFSAVAWGQENRPLHIGDSAFNIIRDAARITVVAKESNGAYVIRFEDGPLAGQVGGGWGRGAFAVPYGCGENRICTGDRVINIDRDAAWTRVVGIQVDGRMVLSFLDGPLAGQKGANWQAHSLAIPRGCGIGGFCVGDRVYNRDRNFDLCQITAIQQDGRYVIRFLQGPIQGRQGGNWQHFSFIRQQ